MSYYFDSLQKSNAKIMNTTFKIHSHSCHHQEENSQIVFLHTSTSDKWLRVQLELQQSIKMYQNMRASVAGYRKSHSIFVLFSQLHWWEISATQWILLCYSESIIMNDIAGNHTHLTCLALPYITGWPCRSLPAATAFLQESGLFYYLPLGNFHWLGLESQGISIHLQGISKRKPL